MGTTNMIAKKIHFDYPDKYLDNYSDPVISSFNLMAIELKLHLSEKIISDDGLLDLF